VLAHHRDGLTREERAAAHARIAALEERLGRPLRAIAALNEALTADPEARAPRERLLELLEARGDFRAALSHRRRLAEALPPKARVPALCEIAAVCRDRLEDIPSAVEALEAAARIAPSDVSVADDLASAYLRVGQSQRAADALARVVAHPASREEPRRTARVALALGRLQRDRVRNPVAAARAFEEALELDPLLAEAVTDLEGLLAAERRWRDLEGVYSSMLERIPRTPETTRARVVLWRALQGLYANAIGDHEAARTAAQVADSIEAGAPAPAGG
jgi:tetratricopeptide (TPR) repeat protein